MRGIIFVFGLLITAPLAHADTAIHLFEPESSEALSIKIRQCQQNHPKVAKTLQVVMPDPFCCTRTDSPDQYICLTQSVKDMAKHLEHLRAIMTTFRNPNADPHGWESGIFIKDRRRKTSIETPRDIVTSSNQRDGVVEDDIVFTAKDETMYKKVRSRRHFNILKGNCAPQGTDQAALSDSIHCYVVEYNSSLDKLLSP